MNRVSTSGNYAIVLANLANAETQQITAGNQVSSQKVATDLKGYAGKAETLTAMQSAKAKVDGLVEQNAVLANRFADQDTALNQISDAAGTAATAISDALASGSVDTLMQQLSGAFSDSIAGLNTKSQGVYLFSGGQINTAPMSARSMSDLTSGPALSTFFKNDQLVTKSQIDETASVSGGMLASNVGTGLMQAFKNIQAYQDANGAFTGKLTDAQRTFLEGQLGAFTTEHTNLINETARNGAVQRQVTDAGTALTGRQNGLEGMIGGITAVNMADAVSRLQTAQIAVQASAQVFTALNSASLLNYLPAS